MQVASIFYHKNRKIKIVDGQQIIAIIFISFVTNYTDTS